MDCMKGCPWDWEIVVLTQPSTDGGAKNCHAQKSGTEAQLFAAVNQETKIFKEEPRIVQRGIRQEGLVEKVFGFSVSKIVCFCPPIQIGDATLLLVPLHPLPVNGKGERVNSGVCDLDVVKTWLCDINVLVLGAGNCGFSVQGCSDFSGHDVVLLAEDIKEAEGAQDPRKFSAT